MNVSGMHLLRAMDTDAEQLLRSQYNYYYVKALTELTLTEDLTRL